VSSGGTLNINGYTLSEGENISVAGTGASGQTSALIGSGTIQGDLILTADASIGGIGGILQVDTGTLELASGADVRLRQINLSNGASADGAVLTISDGSALTAQYLNIGQGSGTAGTVNQTGGTVTLIAGENAYGIRIGHWGSGGKINAYNLSGGILDTAAYSGNLIVGWDGEAALTVGGGSGTALAKVNGIQFDGGGAGPGSGTLTVAENDPSRSEATASAPPPPRRPLSAAARSRASPARPGAIQSS
jgi:hypothetical protein